MRLTEPTEPIEPEHLRLDGSETASVADNATKPWSWWAQLPNLLSASRLVLGITFPLLPPNTRFAVVLYAGLSDAADGVLARWLGETGLVGKFLDPIADKVFVLMVLGTLLYESTILTGLAVLGIAVRDLIVVGCALFCMATGRWYLVDRVHPTLFGKAATVAQFSFLLLILWFAQPLPVIWGITTCISLVAGLDYLRMFLGWVNSCTTQ